MPLAANISKKSAKSGEDQYVQRAASAEVVSSMERERQLKGRLLWMESSMPRIEYSFMASTQDVGQQTCTVGRTSTSGRKNRFRTQVTVVEGHYPF